MCVLSCTHRQNVESYLHIKVLLISYKTCMQGRKKCL